MVIPLSIVCILFVGAVFMVAKLDDTLTKERNAKKNLQQELDKIKSIVHSARFRSDSSFHSRLYRELSELVEDAEQENGKI